MSKHSTRMISSIEWYLENTTDMEKSFLWCGAFIDSEEVWEFESWEHFTEFVHLLKGIKKTPREVWDAEQKELREKERIK